MPVSRATMHAVGDISSFDQSDKHVLTWRSYREPSLHESILVYRFSQRNRWYGLTNTCPHLGASLELGDIEDSLGGNQDDQDVDQDAASAPIIMCPWHQYDFNMHDGSSSTGMRACSYKVEVRDDGKLWVEIPGSPGDDFRLIGKRAVSEQFAEGPTLEQLKARAIEASLPSPHDDLLATAPKTLVGFGRLVLMAADPDLKVSLTRELVQRFRRGEIKTVGTSSDLPPPDEPPRPTNVQVLSSGKTLKIGKGGSERSKVRLLHALAAIEQWAIDLSIDIMCRFWQWRMGSEDGLAGDKLPMSFFADFLKVAEDEAKHFSILRKRMLELGTTFGDLPVHHGLWESARETQTLFSRLAIIHLVHEARGLDTNPVQIERMKRVRDHETADVLQIIHDDELTHVACGHIHFTALCRAIHQDPVERFRQEVREHFWGQLRGPFNEADRSKAGMSPEYYTDLHGKHYGLALEPGLAQLAVKDN
ncbi:hypothetical protein OIV83_001427 [Microbotryomycetes sp. JL201]|nr:hypothetical protein OIV83_001427 [Microbotryomycetes sp. JL201]